MAMSRLIATGGATGRRLARLMSVALSLLTGPLAAADFFVALTGDDANPGNETAPFRSIQFAVDRAAPGDTVWVTAGTYAERVTFHQSGTEGAPITLAAHPGHAVVVDAAAIAIADYWQGAITINDVSHIRVQGLRVEHSARTGIIANRSAHIEIRDNQTYDTVLSGIGVWRSNNVVVDGNDIELAVNGGEQECISVSISNAVEVTGNHIRNDGAGTDGGEGIDVKDGSYDVVVRGNHVHDLDELGIYVDSWDSHTHDILIEGNRVHDCTNHGIAIAAERGGLVERIVVRNNLTYRNARMGITIGDWDSGWPHPMQDIRIVNNTSVGNGPNATWGAGIAVLNGAARGVVIRNNLVAGNVYAQILDESGGAEIRASHNLSFGPTNRAAILGTDPVLADPLLADAAADDLRPLPGSPAIDAGIDLDAPADDFDGNPRPADGLVDIGAYEQPSGPLPPLARLAAEPTSGAAPLAVQFTDTSTGAPDTWLWTFGDGTESTEQHPPHVYTEPGQYDVTLTVANAEGSNSTVAAGLITVLPPDTSVVLLADDFESGLGWTTAGHVDWYSGTPKNGTHAMRLRKVGAAERAVPTTGFGTIRVAFAWGAASLDTANERLEASWLDGAIWQPFAVIENNSAFENGQLNPIEVTLPPAAEDNPGLALRLRILGSGTADYGYLDDFVVRGEPLGPPPLPEAGFAAAPTAGSAPLTVAFTDLSAGLPNAWLWDFGDGQSATEPSPVHVYTAPGDYAVTLTVANAGGSDSLTQAGLVSVTEPPADADIYLEDFEADMTGWYKERGVTWYGGEPRIGTRAVQLAGNNCWLEERFSTAGYSNIRLQLAIGARDFEAGETLILYYRNGASWQPIHRVENGSPEEDGALHLIDLPLPADAADNPGFGIAFGQWSADSADFGYLDAIRVSGVPTP